MTIATDTRATPSRYVGQRPAVYQAPGSLPHVLLTKTSAQTMSATWSTVAYNVVLQQQGGMTVTAGVVTVPRDGRYGVSAKLAYAATTALSQLGIRIDGLPSGIGGSDFAYALKDGVSSFVGPVAISGAYSLAAGAQISVGSQSSVGSHGLNVTANFCTLAVTYLGP